MNFRIQQNGNSSALLAYHVPNRRNAAWIRIGAAWPHKDGEGYRLRIGLMPLDVMTSGELTVQLRVPKDDQDETPEPDRNFE